jgi:trans-2,3-dihydro-3-hydroxyanthranilate isomerase
MCCFRKKPFEDMMQSTPHIAQRLLEMTLDELDAAREWMLLLGRKTAREKIASLLAIIARRNASLQLKKADGTMVFDLPLTREEMADYLGLTLETVSRQMSALRKDGLISLEGNRHVTVPDFEALLEVAGDDSDGGMFTQVPFAGNPLAVVLGADGLTTKQMQCLAREFNLSETIFVQRPADPANTARVRIFFPTAEIPFAGHPTIGCAILLAEAAMPEGDFETRIVLEEEAGIVPVAVTRLGGVIYAELTAPVTPHGVDRQISLSNDLLAKATGLAKAQIGFGSHAPAVWQGGPAFLYIPVVDLGALATARPCEPQWSQLMQAAGVDSAYLYTPGQGADYQARMFSPTAGIPEDPATGSASAILAAQLLAAKALRSDQTEISLLQGVEMGRASQIALRVTCENGTLRRVNVGGSALRISQGHIRVPQ